jgi:hypothetical protein
MRINGLIPCAILLALFMVNSQAIMEPDSVSVRSGQSLADALLEQSGSPSTYYAGSGNFTTPKEAREKELQKKKNSALDWAMPSSLSASRSTPSESRNLANDQSSLESPNATSSLQPSNASNNVQIESSNLIVQNASGTWSFILNDSIQKEVALALALFQNGDSVFGTGSIKENNNTYQITASGNLQEDSMSLDITSQQSIRLYKFLLNLSGDNASGKYSAVSASGDKWTGEAEGMRLATES